jgi:F-type H+-transporting ATPase subunit epsilon
MVEIMAEVRTFYCEIDTPDGPVLGQDLAGVKLPLYDGYIGILANHAPITAVLGTGLVTMTQAGGDVSELFLSRGFLRFDDNALAILAEECMPVDQLELEVAWDLLQRAYKLPTDTEEQRILRDEAISAGRIRFALVPKKDGDKANIEELMSKGL